MHNMDLKNVLNGRNWLNPEAVKKLRERLARKKQLPLEVDDYINA
jgi:hypothetical protein